MPPPNNTPATAIQVLLSATPYSNTQDVITATPPDYFVYYKITNDLSHNAVITVWFRGDTVPTVGSSYNPNYEGYNDVTLSTNVFDAFPSCATEIPIRAGDSYWIKVHHLFPPSPPTNGILHVTVETKPYSTIYPAGQILIFSASSDVPFTGWGGLHAGLIDPSGIVNFIPFFTATENGDNLPSNGSYLITDNSGVTSPIAPSQAWYMLLYDFQFNLLTRALFPAPSSGFANGEPLIRTNLATNKFWTAVNGSSGAPNRYASVSSSGVISSITNLPNFTFGFVNMGGVAATNSESHLLVMPRSAANNKIQRWNLSTLAWDAAIGTDFLTYAPRDILVYPDNSIIIVYMKNDNKGVLLKRFDSSGTEINDYPISNSVTITAAPRIGYAKDTNYFWFWLPLTNGQSKLKKIKLSDGSLPVDITVFNVFQTSFQVASPAMIYTSDSCPVIETYFDVGPPPVDDPSGIYMQDTRTSTGGPLPPTVARTNDKLFTSDSSTVEVKIPDPFAILYPTGD